MTCITDQWTRLQWQKSLLRNSWTKNHNNRHSPWILDKNWSRMTFRKHPQCLGCHLNVLYALIYGKYGTFFHVPYCFLGIIFFQNFVWWFVTIVSNDPGNFDRIVLYALVSQHSYIFPPRLTTNLTLLNDWFSYTYCIQVRQQHLDQDTARYSAWGLKNLRILSENLTGGLRSRRECYWSYISLS